MPGRNGATPERGAGLVGTVAGITVILVLLLFATQVLVDLYARSAVTAAAYDAARQVAAARIEHTTPGGLAVADPAVVERQAGVVFGQPVHLRPPPAPVDADPLDEQDRRPDPVQVVDDPAPAVLDES